MTEVTITRDLMPWEKPDKPKPNQIEDLGLGDKKYGTEKSEKRQHIQNRIITTYNVEGVATYSCPHRHEGLPKEQFIGSRREVRKHIMTEHKTW